MADTGVRRRGTPEEPGWVGDRGLSGGPTPGERSLDELLDLTTDHYHDPLRRALPRLETLARTVLSQYARTHPVLLISIGASVLEIRDVLLAHIEREEEVLFPLLRRGIRSEVPPVVRALRADEYGLVESSRRLRELTGDFTIAVAPSPEWGELWRGLAAFDGRLGDYLSFERDVLFPRALAVPSDR